MNKFFVGQRVRLTRPLSQEHLGFTGRITLIGYWRPGDILPNGAVLVGPPSDCGVEWDQYGFSCSELDRLEPILPSGHIASTLSYSELMEKCKEGVMA